MSYRENSPIFHVYSSLIRRTAIGLSSLASDFLGEGLQELDPASQRVLRATVIAVCGGSVIGVLFVGLWAFLGDPRSGLLSICLAIMWMALFVLKRTLWPDLMGPVLGLILLVYWVFDAVFLSHLGPATYVGLYLVPVVAFQFGNLRMGRIFGALAAVVTVALWCGGAYGVLEILDRGASLLLMDRVGLLILMSAFTTVVVYEQRFLDKMLDQSGHAVDVRLHRLGLVRAEAAGHRASDLGETLASVAHDLSNPLTYAMANLEMLLLGDEEESIELMQDSYEGLLRISDIVRGLEHRSQERSEVSIEGVIQLALRSTRAEIDANARLVVDSLDPTISVLGVSSRLVQVLVNLLTNAAQAIPPGHPDQHEIKIRTVLTPDRVEIVVSDTGHGIPDSIRDRVKEPFFTTKSAGEGTRLGLAICSRIVDEHGGSLRFSSGDVGAQVTVSLPRLQRQDPIVETDSAIPVQVSEMESLNVLVIDDDPGMLRLVRRALKPMRVMVLQDGREAAALCAIHDFDVIVCDIMMPNMGGQDVYAAVVAESPRLSTRFLFMTGGAFGTSGAEFVSSVSRRVLQKPTKLSVLREQIVQVARQAESLQARLEVS